MSYILDALRKAETERALNCVSYISTQQSGARRPVIVRRWMVFVVAMGCIIALTWWWAELNIARDTQALIPIEQTVSTRRDFALQDSGVLDGKVLPVNPVPPRRIVSDPADKSPYSTVKAAATRPAPVVDNRAAAEKQTVSSRPSDVNGQPEQSAEHKVPTVTTQQAPSSPVEKTESNVVAIIANEVEQAVDTSPSDQSATQTAVMQHGSEVAKETILESLPAEEILPPLLSTLPYRFQSTLPKIVINAQAYAEEAEARFVIINMKKYREGEQTEAGIRVETIGENYLLLSYQGQVFRMQR